MVDIIVKKSKSKINYHDLDKSNAYEAKEKYKLKSFNEVEQHMRYYTLEGDRNERREVYEKFWKKPK